ATPRLHQGYTKATPRLHQGYTKATPRLHQGYTKATPRLHQSHTKATPKPHQSHTKATPKPGESAAWNSLAGVQLPDLSGVHGAFLLKWAQKYARKITVATQWQAGILFGPFGKAGRNVAPPDGEG